MTPRTTLLLTALLAACHKADPPPDPPREPRTREHTGGECPQNHCVAPPAEAPSQAAPGQPMCPASLHISWAANPNPRPFSPALSQKARETGSPATCCYEAQRLCGGGRPLSRQGAPVLASLTARQW